MAKTKKLIATTLAVLMTFSCTACADDGGSSSEKTQIIASNEASGNAISGDDAPTFDSGAFANESIIGAVQKTTEANTATNDVVIEKTASATNYMAAASSARATSTSEFTYEINNGEVTLFRFVGKSKNVVIPSKYAGRPVTRIASRCFLNNDNITSVVIPNSVKSIGSEAFCACDNLTSVTMTNSVSVIGYEAFSLCKKLKEVQMSNQLTYIGTKAFYECTELSSIAIPNSLVFLGTNAFNRCFQLQTVSVPYKWLDQFICNVGVQAQYICYLKITGNTIPERAFFGNANFAKLKCLYTLEIGYGVKTIGDAAFSWCQNIREVIISDSVKTIGSNAFDTCTKLNSVKIGSGVTSIGSRAFNNCGNITDVTTSWKWINQLSNDIRNVERLEFINDDIPAKAFFGNTNFTNLSKLRYVTIGQGVKNIGYAAFSWCPNIGYLTIASNVRKIENNAFDSCACLYELTLRSSATYVDTYAFRNCPGLMNLDMEGCNLSNNNCLWINNTNIHYLSISNVDIPARAYFGNNFAKLTKINTVKIYGNGNTIGDAAFSWCPNIQEVYIGYHVKTIGNNAFDSCARLKTVAIGRDVGRIGSRVFANCPNLISVATPTRWINKVAEDNKNIQYLHILDGSGDVPSEAFFGNSNYLNLKEVCFLGEPGAVNVRYAAFSWCPNLSAIEINGGRIENNAFDNCPNLAFVSIRNVESIGSRAFGNCDSLTTLIIPKTVKYISKGAFYGCDNLKNVTYPSWVTEAQKKSFFEAP